MIKSRRMRWVKRVASMGEDCIRVLVGEREDLVCERIILKWILEK
jgi:hypothetical protein